MGCKEDLEEPLMIEGIENKYTGDFYRCPIAMITTQTQQTMDAYNRCRVMTELGYQSNGALPFSGGVQDQPAWVMDAFDILDRMVTHIHVQDRKARERRNG